jgi:hypothetical protein
VKNTLIVAIFFVLGFVGYFGYQRLQPVARQQPAMDPVCTTGVEAQTSWAADDTHIECLSSACKPPFSRPTAHIQVFQPQAAGSNVQRQVSCWCCYESAKQAAPAPPPPPPLASVKLGTDTTKIPFIKTEKK